MRISVLSILNIWCISSRSFQLSNLVSNENELLTVCSTNESFGIVCALLLLRNKKRSIQVRQIITVSESYVKLRIRTVRRGDETSSFHFFSKQIYNTKKGGVSAVKDIINQGETLYKQQYGLYFTFQQHVCV